MTPRTALVALAACTALTGAVVAPPATAAGCAKRSGAWSSVKKPTYRVPAVPLVGSPVGGELWTLSLAVDAVDPRRMYATNDRSIVRTTDGGCTWREVWALPDAPAGAEAPYSLQTTRVMRLVASPAARDRLTVYAVLGPRTIEGTPVPQTFVLKSTDGGSTWTRADAGLPPLISSDVWLTVAPSDPQVLYFAATYVGLWASTDGGRSWEQRGSDPIGPSFNDCCAVDPLNANVVWRGYPVSRSTDGGRTFTQALPFRGVVAVEHAGRGPARVLAASLEGFIPRVVQRSEDGGARFAADQPIPVAPDAIFTGRNARSFVVVEVGQSLTSLMRYDGSKRSGARWSRLDLPAGKTIGSGGATVVVVRGSGSARTLTVVTNDSISTYSGAF